MHVSSKVSPDTSVLSDYPELAHITDPVWLDAVARATHHHFRAGVVLESRAAPMDQFLLVLSGTVRVYYAAPDGREITLYTKKPGDLCVLSLNNLLHARHFEFMEQPRTDVHLLGIATADFHACLAGSDTFRRYVLTALLDRFFQLMTLVQDTVFQKLDMRLACLLGRLCQRARSSTLRITHQELARELGTTREVVSRILKQFEQRNYIRLARGQIRLCDETGLARHGRRTKHVAI